MIHMEGCSVGVDGWEICHNPHQLSDGKHHWWSGWPGSVCLGCNMEDQMEHCIGAGCECPCHDFFWKDLEERQ